MRLNFSWQCDHGGAVAGPIRAIGVVWKSSCISCAPLHGGSFQRRMGLWLEWWFYCRLGVMEVRKCEGSVACGRRFGVVQVAVDLQLHAGWLLEMCGRLLWQGAVLCVQSGGGGVMLF